MDNTPHLEAVRKTRDIAYGLGATEFSEEEDAMIASILPSPETIWKTCVRWAEKLEESHAENVKTHTANCVCLTCVPWWSEPEDPEEAARVRETTDLLMEILGGKAPLPELKTYPRAPTNPQQLRECIVLARQFNYGELTDQARDVFGYWAAQMNVDIRKELKDG